MKNKIALSLLLICFMFVCAACVPGGSSVEETALEELNALIPELNIFLEASFTRASKTTFNWMEKDKGLKQVSGYVTESMVKVKGDFTRVNQASKLLVSKGFSSDPDNVTEILCGFRKGNTVCLILLGSYPENDNLCKFTVMMGELR